MKLRNWTKHLVIIESKECEAWFLNGKFVPEFGVYQEDEVTVIEELRRLK